jgi:sulfonate transport system substrate-binding protein
MRKITIIGLVAILAIFGLVALVGCSSSSTTTSTEPTTVTTASTTTGSVTTGTSVAATATVTPISPAVTVGVAFDDAPGTAALILADKLGFFKAVGINVKYTKFQSGADMYTALATNKLDVGRGILTASLYNGAASGVKVWVVADAGTNVPNKNFFGIVVRKDLAGQIKDYKDLKGRTILIVSKGSVNQLFLDKALAKAGLTEKDVTVKIIDSFPDLNTALGNKAADVAVQIEPLITQGVDSGLFVRFPKDAVDYAPGEEIAPLFYADNFKVNAQVANNFMVAYLQGARAYNDAIVQGTKDQANVVAILSKNTFVNDKTMWVKMNPTGVDPNGFVDPKAVAVDQAFYVKAGLVPNPVPLSQIIDNSFTVFANKVLGPYTPPAK